MAFRTYVWGDEPQRLPQDFYKRAYPLFATTRQKIVTVYFEGGGRWIVSGSGEGSVLQFNSEGRWDRDFSAQGAGAILQAAGAREADPPRIDRLREAQRMLSAHRWRLSKADEARIAADLGGKAPIPLYKAPPPATAKMNDHKFRATLKAQGLTQAELANRFGIDARTVNRWATGKLPVPQYVTAYFEALSGNAPMPSRRANGRAGK